VTDLKQLLPAFLQSGKKGSLSTFEAQETAKQTALTFSRIIGELEMGVK